MNLTVDRYSLKVTGINRPPQVNEFEVLGVEDIHKEITVPVKIPKVNKEGSTLYLLPRPDKEVVTPTPRTVETDEVTDRPVVVKKTRQVPLLDDNGDQVKYFPTTISYEQVGVGTDEEDNPIYETVEVENVSETPIFCFTTEEYEEETGRYLTEMVEDVITYEEQTPWEITDGHNAWSEELEVILVDAEEPKMVSLSQSPEHFSYEEVEPSLYSYKQIRLGDIYNQYQAEKTNHVVSSLVGEDGQNIIFPYGEPNQKDYHAIGITFALDPDQTESIIGSESHGKFYISREDFMTLTKEFQSHEVDLYMKMKEKEMDILSEDCNTVELVNAIVW